MTGWKLIPYVCLLFTVSVLFSACAGKEDSSEQTKIDFTVVEEVDYPEELSGIIAEKKETPFKLTYSYQGYLYIVQGYGEQATGGYSIQVDDVYETENAVYFSATLMGPGKEEEVTQAKTYPYIVVKIKDIDKSVVFPS
jgi:hypothetical protein